MVDMTTGPHMQVKIAGKLTRITENGARALTAEEFHDVMDRIAAHLDSETRITDPCTWGRASTGDTEIYFVLTDPADDPEHLDRRVGSIIKRMNHKTGLIQPTESHTTTTSAANTMLTQTHQLREPAPA